MSLFYSLSCLCDGCEVSITFALQMYLKIIYLNTRHKMMNSFKNNYQFLSIKPKPKILGMFKNCRSVYFPVNSIEHIFVCLLLLCVLGDFVFLILNLVIFGVQEALVFEFRSSAGVFPFPLLLGAHSLAGPTC